MGLNARLEQLLDLLSQEAGLYLALLAVIDKEAKAAVRSELNALNQAGVEKENILAALGKSDGRRRRLVACLSEELGYPLQDLTLKKLSQLVDEPFAGRLRQASNDLSAVLSRVQEANQRSKHLFAHSLELARGAFSLLNELLCANSVYYRTGNVRSSSSTGKCVCSDI